MNEALKFVMGLIDEATGPARVMDSAIAKLQKRIEKLTKANKFTGDGLIELAAQLVAPRSAINDLTSVAGFASEAFATLSVSAVGLAAAGYAFAAHAADFEHTTLASLEIMEGSHAKALETLEILERGANSAGLPTDKIAGWYKQLRNLGTTANITKQFIAASLDVESYAGGGAGEKLLATLEKLQQRGGKLDKKELRGSGLQEDAIAETLSHMEGATKGMGIPAIRNMLEQGQIDAVTGTQAILDTIRRTIDSGDALGAFNAKLSPETISGSFQAARNNIEHLFAGAINTGPALDGIHKIAAAFDVNTETGKRMQAILGSVFGTIGDLIEKITQPGTLDGIINGFLRFAGLLMDIGGGIIGGFVDGIMDFMGPLMDVFGELNSGGSSMKDVFHTVGEVVGWLVGIVIDFGVVVGLAVYGIVKTIGLIGEGIAAVWKASDDFGEGIIQIFVDAASWLVDAGGNIVAGLWKGLKDGWKTLVEDFKGLVDLLPAAVKTALGIHSPSIVFAELGAYTGQGFAQGITSENDNAMAAMSRLVTPPVPAPFRVSIDAPEARSQGAEGRSGNTYNITVHATAGGGADTHSLAQTIAAEVRRVIDSASDDMISESAA